MQRIFLALLLLAAAVPARADDAAAVVANVDAILSPKTFTAKVEMVTHRSDGSVHTYRMQLFKLDRDKTRLNFEFPPDQAGTQLLRQDENMWMYLVNIKRAIRVASRQQLMGGDFNNGDLLRLSLVEDYASALSAETATEWVIDLRAKSDDVTYDRIVLRVAKKDSMPLEEKIYTLSGKHVKTLVFEDPKRFGKLRRPAKVTMIDELDENRKSVLTYESLDTNPKFTESYFTINQLGR